MKIKALVASLLVLSMLASGCAVTVDQPEAEGDMTAEQVAVEVLEELNEIDSAHTVLDLEINAKVGQGLIGLPAKISGIVDADVVKDEPAAHAVATFSASAVGQSMEQGAEAYAIVEGDTGCAFVNYDGSWQKADLTDVQIPAGILVERAYIGQIIGGAGLELEDGLVAKDAGDCYCLKTSLDGELLQPIVEPALEQADLGLDLSVVDWSAADADAAVYVTADDFRIASIEIDASALGEQIVALLSEMQEIKDMNVRIALSSCDIIMTYDNYNGVSVELPAELAAM